MQKCLIKYDIGGSYINNELLKIIESKTQIHPHYKFTKNKIDDVYTSEYFDNIRDDPSYESFWKKEIIKDLKENCLAVSEEPLNKY